MLDLARPDRLLHIFCNELAPNENEIRHPAYKETLNNALAEAWPLLMKSEQLLLTLRYGLDGGALYSRREISTTILRPVKHVDHILEKGLQRLSSSLEPYL